MSDDITPLGRLFRQRRQLNKVSWKRLEKAVGLEDETMMRWERGTTKDPPITKALLFAREVGISLEELQAVLLPASDEHAQVEPNPREGSAEAASVRDKRKAGGEPPSRRARRPRSA